MDNKTASESKRTLVVRTLQTGFALRLTAMIIIVVMAGVTIPNLAKSIPSASAAASSKSCDNFSKSPNGQANYNPHCLEEELGVGPPLPRCNEDFSNAPCRNHPNHP